MSARPRFLAFLVALASLVVSAAMLTIRTTLSPSWAASSLSV